MDQARTRTVLIWVAVAAVALVVIGALVYESMVAQTFKQTLPQSSAPVSFVETGLAETYTLIDGGLGSVTPEKAGDFSILEAADGPHGEKVVLASASNVAGVVLGILENGQVRPLVNDGKPKADLHVTADGVALYAVYAHGIVWAASVPQLADDSKPAAGDIEGSATGPVDAGVNFTSSAPATPAPAVELFAANLSGGAPRSLGAGKNPRIRADGSVVALTPDGVDTINIATGDRAVIVPRPHGDGLGSSLSPNGTAVLFRADGAKVGDIYAIGQNEGQYAGTLAFEGNVFGGVFADDSHVFIRTALNRAALYNVRQTMDAQPPVSTLPVVIVK